MVRDKVGKKKNLVFEGGFKIVENEDKNKQIINGQTLLQQVPAR
jgi:hypothetical protein